MAYRGASQVSTKSRYTISRLRELSLSSSTPFDLSKFSFDAVRAGVVPALSQCTATMREPSANRPRGWSSETMSSMDEGVIYPGQSGQNPVRQPKVPPTEDLAQTNLGFARFLKKHASPTHQRVTAGGRIVPMEKRPAPPKFALKDDMNPIRDNTSQCNEKGRTNGILPLKTEVQSGNTTTSHPHAPQVSFGSFSTSPGLPTSQMSFGSINTGASLDSFANGIPDLGYGLSPMPFSPMLHPAAFASALPPDQHAISATMLYPSSMPLIAPTPIYPNQYAMMPIGTGIWSYPDTYSTPALLPSPSLEQLLSQATAEFQDLEQQLKDLDRERAMNNFDKARAARRVELIDQRSKAFDNVRCLRIALNLDPGTGANKTSTSTPSARPLNVEAAAWVPKTGPRVSQPVRIKKPDAKESKTIVLKARLPATSAAFSSPSQNDPFVATVSPLSPEIEGVDEWGVRLGRAPPELERQQSEMLESMTSERTSSPSSSVAADEDVLMAERCSSIHSKFEDNNDVADDAASDADSEMASEGQAPQEVEHDYSLHLDAMRMPKGVTTHVRTHEGQVFIVAGQALQRPASANMTEFEQKYWSRTSADGAKKASGRDQENAGTDGGKARGWNSEMDPVAHKYDNRISTFRKGNSQKAFVDVFKGTTNEPRRVAVQDRKVQDSMENMSMILPQTPSDILRGIGSGLLENAARDVDMSFADANGNKGYSSVAVQNIHAISRLPQGLDGAIDKIQKVATASRVKSPRILHRATPTGNAWYGPFRREIVEQLEKGDNPRK